MGKEFRGSSYGWVVTISYGPELYLFNPLTKVRIALPPLYTFPNIRGYFPDKTGEEYSIMDRKGNLYSYSHTELQDMFIQKLVLSSPPHDDYLAIAINGEQSRLAFCRSNDKKLTAVKTRFFGFSDVIFYEDKIYALCKDAQLIVFDKSSLPNFTPVRAKVPNPILYYTSSLYLVGSNTGLMMVARFRNIGEDEINDRCTYKTEEFKIYMLKSYSRKKRLRWTKITTLGDNAMFLGHNASILVSTINFPKLKGNCVYFTDDEMEKHDADKYGGFDIGVFDLDEGCVEEFRKLSLGNELVWPPPV